MGGRGPQSFKKRQKEQQRKEKQQEKLARKIERKLRGPMDAEDEPLDPSMADLAAADEDTVESAQPKPPEAREIPSPGTGSVTG